MPDSEWCKYLTRVMAVDPHIRPGGRLFHPPHFTGGDIEAPWDKISCPRIYNMHRLNPGLATHTRLMLESRIFSLLCSASRLVSLSFNAGHLFWNYERVPNRGSSLNGRVLEGGLLSLVPLQSSFADHFQCKWLIKWQGHWKQRRLGQETLERDMVAGDAFSWSKKKRAFSIIGFPEHFWEFVFHFSNCPWEIEYLLLTSPLFFLLSLTLRSHGPFSEF